MRSLKLDSSGDIVFDGRGSLSFVEGSEKIIQRINIKLKTIRGELFYFDEFGLERMVRKVSREVFTANIQNAILPDPDISYLEVVDFSIRNNGYYRVHILFYLFDGTTLEFDM